MINLQFETKVTLLDTKLVPNIKPNHTFVCIIFHFDQDYLVGKFICNSYLWSFFIFIFFTIICFKSLNLVIM